MLLLIDTNVVPAHATLGAADEPAGERDVAEGEQKHGQGHPHQRAGDEGAILAQSAGQRPGHGRRFPLLFAVHEQRDQPLQQSCARQQLHIAAFHAVAVALFVSPGRRR